MNKKTYRLGKNSSIDPDVTLGYPPERLKHSTQLSIGKDARIRRGTVVYGGTTIGDGFASGHNVVIREENTIGDHVAVWNNTTIDYGCKIGNNVKIHSNCYVAQLTVIEDNAFLAPGVTIANDPHPGCHFSKKCMAGPTIKRGAQIGCNVTILPMVTIGKNCLIGAGSVITKNIPDNSVAYGNPAKVHKKINSLKCLFDFTDKPYPEE